VPDDVEWQVVLVNNDCTDETDKVAQSYAGRLPLLYAHEPRRGVSRARNKGLEIASGNLIVFTDDDVKPCARWIATYWQAYRAKPHGFIFGGPVESEFGSITPDEELLRVAPGSVRGLTFGSIARELSPREGFIGANWACAAAPLKALGGFDVTRGAGVPRRCLQSGEETLLMDRLRSNGMRAWYLPEATLRHFVPVEKCTLKHIGHRMETYGYFVAWERCSFSDYLGTPRLFGVPAWMYRKSFELLRGWCSAKINKQKAYREYLEWRRFLGTTLAVRDVIASKKNLNSIQPRLSQNGETACRSIDRLNPS
jgi:GT2 family glycosyltransferase